MMRHLWKKFDEQRVCLCKHVLSLIPCPTTPASVQVARVLLLCLCMFLVGMFLFLSSVVETVHINVAYPGLVWDYRENRTRTNPLDYRARRPIHPNEAFVH